MTNVHVHPFALGDHDGTARFGGNGTSKTFALHAGDELVDIRRARTLIADGECSAPTFVKIDVEGAEAGVLAGALEILPGDARLLIAVHGPVADEQCARLLERAGFDVEPSAALRASRQGDWNGDPDLFCTGPDVPDRVLLLDRLRTNGF
jgi:hypothetical protein